MGDGGLGWGGTPGDSGPPGGHGQVSVWPQLSRAAPGSGPRCPWPGCPRLQFGNQLKALKRLWPTPTQSRQDGSPLVSEPLPHHSEGLGERSASGNHPQCVSRTEVDLAATCGPASAASRVCPPLPCWCLGVRPVQRMYSWKSSGVSSWSPTPPSSFHFCLSPAAWPRPPSAQRGLSVSSLSGPLLPFQSGGPNPHPGPVWPRGPHPPPCGQGLTLRQRTQVLIWGGGCQAHPPGKRKLPAHS